jgi:hypothetical protein
MPHLSLSRLCSQISPLLVLAASLLGPSVTAFSAEVRLASDGSTTTTAAPRDDSKFHAGYGSCVFGSEMTNVVPTPN